MARAKNEINKTKEHRSNRDIKDLKPREMMATDTHTQRENSNQDQ